MSFLTGPGGSGARAGCGARNGTYATVRDSRERPLAVAWQRDLMEGIQAYHRGLGQHLPDDAEVDAVRVSDDQSIITIWTSTPAEVIGRRGSTAGSINQALKTSLGAHVTLQVQEVRDSSDEVDLFDEGQFGGGESFGGVREPKSPTPDQPGGAGQLDLPKASS